jgi:replicative DNA helicase
MSLGSEILKQTDAVVESVERFKEYRTRDWGLVGADTGIHPLNMVIGGWIPGKVTVIAARSGHGKTALTPQMFQAGRRIEGKRRAKYLFFSWETDGSYIVDRNICNLAGVTLRQLAQGAKLLGPRTLHNIEEAYKGAKSLPVSYHMNSTNISHVQELYKEFAEECRNESSIEGVEIVPVIVVDYIGLAEFKKNDIRSYDVADFVNGIKKSVNEERGAACLLAQIKRSSDDKEYPDRADLSDSQSIEQAADNLIILHRPEYNNVKSMKDPSTGEMFSSEDKAMLRVLKARDGATGDLIVGCDIKHFRFYDLGHNWDFPYWENYRKKEFWLKEFGL